MDDDDAIAIVGIGGKFPGADNIKEFWKILVNGYNCIEEIPPERWNIEAFYDSDPDAAGKTYVRKAGLLRRHDEFDNKMFEISDIEAERMDPQQRYVLECVHMAFEDGGLSSSVMKGTDTGVFIGVMNDDYKGMSGDDLSTMTNYSLTGTSQSIISARVSYVYNLLGPSMVIDTACSSSLVAIDTGIQNLKSGRCSMVICGGVNSIVSPDLFVPLSRARMVSPTGQCQAFSANADGYCRGEGCGIVILKRLGQAKRDMNKIWATIATDCNQDGHTATPITAPSSLQQDELLRRIYSENRINPSDIQVIEAHGTGTPVGDPIEINTLGRFFTNGRPEGKIGSDKVYVASVKTNIGHLESAAGVASLIKVLLMMKNKTIVPSLHFSAPNPKIEFQRFRFEVPVKPIHWSSLPAISRLACANCFGFGGTNAHAIIKDYEKKTNEFQQKCSKHLVFLSYPGESGLKHTLETFIQDISQNTYSICDVSYTSICRRNLYSSRLAFLADNMNDLKSKMEQRKQQQSLVHSVQLKPTRMIAVFCGVGTVWRGMCKELLAENDCFRDSVLKVDCSLKQWTPMSIYDILMKGEEISDPFTCHIAIFTCQIALWTLWMSFGLNIDAVVGQSVGEVAASYASGCLNLDQAVKVIYLRSKCLADVTGGKMFVTGNCKTTYIETVCSKFKGKACVAVHASSKSCVVACDADIVDVLKQSIISHLSNEQRAELFLKDLDVKCAYHSHHTEKAGTVLEQAIGKLKVVVPNIEVVSSVTGIQADADTFDQKYWNTNVSKPVLFKPAIMTAGHNDKFNIFLEIGPKPVLRPHLLDSFSVEDAVCLSSMEVSDQSTMLKSAGKMFEYKVNLDWQKVSCKGEVCDVPTIPLNPTLKGIYLSDYSLLKKQGLGQNRGSHLFVSRTHDKKAMFKLTLSEKTTPFVYQHFVTNSIVVPGAFYAEVALEVGHTMTGARVQDICVKVEFLRPIQLSAQKTYFAEVTLTHSSKDLVSGFVQRRNETIASFDVIKLDESVPRATISIENLQKECIEKQDSKTTYHTLNELGFSYGAELKILGDAIKNKTQCLVEMHLSDMIWNDVKTTHIHPAILDGLFQTPGVLALDFVENGALLPGGIEQIVIRRGVERDMLAYAEIASKSKKYTSYNMALMSLSGSIIAEVKNYKIKYVLEMSTAPSLEYEVKWKEANYNYTNFVPNRRKVLLFSFDSDILTDIEKNISIENEVVSVLLKCVSLNEQKAMLREVLKEAGYFQFAFIPGFRMTDSLKGTEVFTVLKMSCVFMLAVVQVLGETGQYVPITVVTECTQAYDTKKCDRINLYGSELWGQVRSIVREDPVLDIILLDCQPTIESANLIIKEIMKERPIGFGELVCENGNMYSNSLKRDSRSLKESFYKFASVDDDCKVQIKALRQNDISKTFLELEKPPQNVSDQEVVVNLKDVFLHTPDLHATTIQTSGQSGYSLYSHADFGLDILTFEATATEALAEREKTQMEVTISSKSADKVILYPMTVKSTVVVPRESVYSLDTLKGYKPGMLITAALMHALSSHVIHKHPLVIHDKKHEQYATLLQFFFKNVHGCSAIMDSTLKPTSNAIILKVLNNKDIQELMASDSLQSITTLSSFLTHSQKLTLEMNGIHVKRLQIDEVLNQRALLSFGQIIRKYLSGHLLEIPDNCENADVSINHFLTFGETVSLRHEHLKYHKTIRLPKNMLLRKDCSYIVVGGLTGLGWEIVKLLALNGAGEVITISRRFPNAEKEKEMIKISKNCSCIVRSLSADVVDWKSVHNVFAEIDKTSTLKVKGIFQGAGILRDALSLQMSEDELEEVMKPKVLGTWNLHLISLRYQLDYFVMHSSVTSVLGNIGQNNYGAANAFLDSLAHFRRIKNLSGQSINWGPLALGMMKEGSNLANLDVILKQRGYITMEVDQICQCFMNALLNDQVQVMFGLFDWKVFGRTLSTVSNSVIKYKLRSFLGDNEDPTIASNLNSQDELLCILNAPEDRRKEKIMETILAIAGEAFLHNTEHLSTMTLIGELGIDSMQVMTFANKLHEIFGIRIPWIVFISEETTFDTIACLVHEQLMETGPKPSKLEATQDKAVLSPIERPLYDAYLFNSNDPTLTIFADLELSQRVADPKIWEGILKQLQNKYSTLRTLIQVKEDTNEILKLVSDPNNTMLDFREVAMNELDHEGRFPNDMRSLRFEASKDFPIRVLFANNLEKCILRLVFNHLFLDFSSISTLVNDLPNMYFHNMTPGKEEIAEKDVYPVFHKHLAEAKARLSLYWKKRTPQEVSSMSLSGLPKEGLDYNQISFSSCSIPTTMIGRLRNAMQMHKIKLSELVVSFYHMLLHQRLQTDTVVFFMNVDMRIHFPEYKNFVGRFANLIPLYAKIEREMTLLSFIKSNQQLLSDGLENSLLPYRDIVELLTGVTPFNAHRHQMTMEYRQDIDTSLERLKNIKMKRIVTGNYNMETQLLVWYNIEKNYLNFELVHNNLAVDRTLADTMLRMLEKMITTFIEKPLTPLVDLLDIHSDSNHHERVSGNRRVFREIPGEIPDQLNVQNYTSQNDDQMVTKLKDNHSMENQVESENSKPAGLFFKRTQGGWSHPVWVTITGAGRRCGLAWGKKRNSFSKTIYFIDMKEISIAESNGTHLIYISGKNRKYAFSTTDTKVIDGFKTFIADLSCVF